MGTLEIERDDGGGQNGQQVVLRDSRFAIAGMGPWELETGAGREGAAGVPDGRRRKNPDLGKCRWRVGGKRRERGEAGSFLGRAGYLPDSNAASTILPYAA